MFALLKEFGIPVAFDEQNSPTTFRMPLCDMLPWEVVVRREAHGSFLKRNRLTSLGTRFEPLVTEFYLKTKNRLWGDTTLPCDDPYAVISNRSVFLYDPAKPVLPGEHFLRLTQEEVSGKSGSMVFSQMRRQAEAAFRILELAWEMLDCDSRLVDFKVEFGMETRTCALLLADVIDNDSWRVLHDGKYVDKQGYRDGDRLETVQRNYEWVANQVVRFPSFKDRILAEL